MQATDLESNTSTKLKKEPQVQPAAEDVGNPPPEVDPVPPRPTKHWDYC